MLHAAILGYQLLGSLLPHSRATGYVVNLVAHERKQVYNLRGALQSVTRTNLLRPAHLEIAAAIPWLVLENVRRHQLPEVLVRRHHIGRETLLLRLTGQCADHVVSLESVAHHHRDVVRLDDALYVRYRQLYVLWSLSPLALVLL